MRVNKKVCVLIINSLIINFKVIESHKWDKKLQRSLWSKKVVEMGGSIPPYKASLYADFRPKGLFSPFGTELS